jgi:hypothetical protein
MPLSFGPFRITTPSVLSVFYYNYRSGLCLSELFSLALIPKVRPCRRHSASAVELFSCSVLYAADGIVGSSTKFLSSP